MQSSKRNNPCPVCSRVKDSDCRWNDEVILCHRGSTNSPPENLRVGNTLEIEGRTWALVATCGGFDGQAYVFKHHQEKVNPHRENAWPDHKKELFERSIQAHKAKKRAEQFFHLAQKAVDVLEFVSATPEELKESFSLIYQAKEDGEQIQKELKSLVFDNKELAPILELVIKANKEINYQYIDANHFRKNFLGEVLHDIH
tara:strand:- start:3388 stop:3987 length:600 start_codon:yes stop_codon:yes gene_type:complete